MVTRIPSYLRTYRRRNNLTQDELAFLLGYQSGTKISRFEQLARVPNLESAIACEVVFGRSASKLFPRMYAEVEKTVTERARQLSSRLQSEDDDEPGRLRQKLAILNAIVGREEVAHAKKI